MSINSTGTNVIAINVISSNSYRKIYYSTNSGQTWGASSTTIVNFMFANYSQFAIAISGTKAVYCSGNTGSANGGIIYSNDSGATWARSNAPTTFDWLSVATNNDGTLMVALYNDKTIYKSTNGGSTWIATSIMIANSTYVSIFGTTVLVGTYNMYYLYKNNLNTANPYTSFSKPAGTPTEVGVFNCIGTDSSVSYFLFLNEVATASPNYIYTTRNANANTPIQKNISTIFKAKGANTAAVTGYKVNGADLNTLYAPLSDGFSIGYDTGYDVNGADLSTKFASL
jgi:hypothetical protein